MQPTVTGGNGHLYRCIVAGTTNATEPSWPLTENATVTDGGVTWQELTPVLVNRLPAPNGPQPTRVAGGGTFTAGRDIYLEMTYLNAQGESIASAPGILVNTNLNDAAQFTVPALSSLAGWIRGLASAYQPTSVNVYQADVATGAAAPSSASFAQVGNFALGATVTVTDDGIRSGPALLEHRQGHARRIATPAGTYRGTRLRLGQLPCRARCLRDRHLYQRSRRDPPFPCRNADRHRPQ